MGFRLFRQQAQGNPMEMEADIFGRNQGNPMDIDIDPNDIFSTDVVRGQDDEDDLRRMAKFEQELKKEDNASENQLNNDIQKSAFTALTTPEAPPSYGGPQEAPQATQKDLPDEPKKKKGIGQSILDILPLILGSVGGAMAFGPMGIPLGLAGMGSHLRKQGQKDRELDIQDDYYNSTGKINLFKAKNDADFNTKRLGQYDEENDIKRDANDILRKKATAAIEQLNNPTSRKEYEFYRDEAIGRGEKDTMTYEQWMGIDPEVDSYIKANMGIGGEQGAGASSIMFP